MKLTTKAIVYPIGIIITLVILPRFASILIPAGTEEMMRMVIDLNALTSISTAVGIALASISFIKNTTDSWSPANLLAAISSDLVDLYLFMLLIGLGDASSLGVTSTRIPIGPGATITYDFKFFALFQVLIVGFAITHSGLKFYYSRKKHFAQLTTQN